MTTIDWENIITISKNSRKDDISQITDYTIETLKAEIPLAVNDWIAQYGLPETELPLIEEENNAETPTDIPSDELVGNDRDEH
jgi:hypothetical protein